MASILIHTADESVTLTAQTVKRLLDRGDGDAALLYLALLRHHGTVQPRSLAGELRWEKSRIEAAEQALRDLRLLAPAAEEIPEPADEKPSYQRDDIARRLESSEEFRLLTAEVEKKLGKRLTTPDVGVLLGLNDYLGLPADVIFLLVNHCVERVTRKYGEGRRPTLRQIEKEGYAWARRGIDTQRAAVEYLKKYTERQGAIPPYMRPVAGGIGGEVSERMAGDGLSAGDGGSGLRQDGAQVPRTEVALLQRHFEARARGGFTYPGGDRTGGQAPGEAADAVGGRCLEIRVRRERGHGIRRTAAASGAGAV